MKKFLLVIPFLFALTACGDDAPDLTENGGACIESSECESNDCRQESTGCHLFFGCGTIELTGGMCTNECTWLEEGTEEERLQSDCAEGEQCLAPAGDPTATLCYQGCEVDEDCREDWECTPISNFKTCLPPEDSSSSRVVEIPDFLLEAPILEAVE
jgi:hypothetical protein